MKLTMRLIEAADPSEKDYVIWDHDLAGFGVRIRAKGAKTFVAKARIGRGRMAKQVWLTIGKPGVMTVDDARRKARLLLVNAAEGETPPSARIAAPVGPATVRELCELWLEKGALRSRQRGRLAGSLRDPSNIAIDRGRIEAHIIPQLGKDKLAALSVPRIEAFRDAVARGDTAQSTKTKPHGVRRVTGGEGTATRTLRLLSSILSFGVREGVLASNVAIGIEKTPDRSLERFLSADEMQRLGEVLMEAEKKAFNPSALAIIRMLALSGARRGEIEQLRWKEIDFQTGFLRLPTSKTGAKVIPMTGPMRNILEAQFERRSSDWVFPDTTGLGPYEATGKAWTKLRKVAELDDVRLHDLRHSAASFGLAGGLGLEVIGKLLGHRDLKTTRRYAHLADSHLRAAAEGMADGISDLLGLSIDKPKPSST